MGRSDNAGITHTPVPCGIFNCAHLCGWHECNRYPNAGFGHSVPLIAFGGSRCLVLCCCDILYCWLWGYCTRQREKPNCEWSILHFDAILMLDGSLEYSFWLVGLCYLHSYWPQLLIWQLQNISYASANSSLGGDSSMQRARIVWFDPSCADSFLLC